MTIYIKRSVKEDGMPKKAAHYLAFSKSEQWIWLYYDVGFKNWTPLITHWLDPVELPSEEEIKEGAKESAGGTYGEAWIERLVGFIDGVNWLLNKLNSKGK